MTQIPEWLQIHWREDGSFSNAVYRYCEVRQIGDEVLKLAPQTISLSGEDQVGDVLGKLDFSLLAQLSDLQAREAAALERAVNAEARLRTALEAIEIHKEHAEEVSAQLQSLRARIMKGQGNDDPVQHN